jgi:hypothetical protein
MKDADFVAAIMFMFASTNLVFEPGIGVAGPADRRWPMGGRVSTASRRSWPGLCAPTPAPLTDAVNNGCAQVRDFRP